MDVEDGRGSRLAPSAPVSRLGSRPAPASTPVALPSLGVELELDCLFDPVPIFLSTSLAKALLLSLRDAYSRFSHLKMGKTARELTVINTVLGLIEWLTMP